jgi:epoxyqueuosine reductase
MKEAEKKTNPARWVEGIIKDFINRSPENTVKNPANDKAWDDPLVGFSRGDDPLYQAYKEAYIGPFHWTPLELFKMAFPQLKVGADELTVISYILPQMDKAKADLRKEKLYPSESWARARIFGEEVNEKLRKHVVDTLISSGIEAVAPMLFSAWGRRLSDRFGFASTWSERHAAHAAGLGTFGLCDGLITPKGNALRFGDCPDKDSTDPEALQGPSCLLSVLFPRHLRKMHCPMPRRCGYQVGPRQAEMQGLPGYDPDLRDFQLRL